MNPVTWKKENQIVELRQRDDWWRVKNTIEERDTYQGNAETHSTMNTEKGRFGIICMMSWTIGELLIHGWKAN